MNEYESYISLPGDYYRSQLKGHGLRKRWLARRQLIAKRLLDKYYNGGRILDIGCGNSLWNTTSAPVIGIDICEQMLRNNCQRNPSFIPIICDISRRLPIADQRVSFIVITEVLEHLPSYQYLIGEIWRVLKKGGMVVASVPYAQFPGIWGLIFPLWCRYKGRRDKDEYYLNMCGHKENFGINKLRLAFKAFVPLESVTMDFLNIFLVAQKS